MQGDFPSLCKSKRLQLKTTNSNISPNKQKKKTKSNTTKRKEQYVQAWYNIYTHLWLLVFQLGDFWPFGTSSKEGRPFETLRKGEQPLQDTARKEPQGSSRPYPATKGISAWEISVSWVYCSVITHPLESRYYFPEEKGGTMATAVFFFSRGVGNWGQKSPTYHDCVNFPFSNQKAVGLS